MDLRDTHYCAGLLFAAQFHGAAHHRPREFQLMLESNRPQIRCGSVKVSFFARKNLVAVPVVPFNNPRGTILVSSVKATAVDQVGYMNRAGGLDRVAGVLSDLSDYMDPERHVEASQTASIHWAQHLGYLLGYVEARDNAALLREHVPKHARNSTRLLPGRDTTNATRSKSWRLFVNANIELND